MLTLARHYGEGLVRLNEIARQERISEKYLSQIIIPLKAKGLIQSFRGAHGGYALAMPPREISALEIVEALEGKIHLVRCVHNQNFCQRISICVTRSLWQKLEESITKTLIHVSLEDLVRQGKEKKHKTLTYTI